MHVLAGYNHLYQQEYFNDKSITEETINLNINGSIRQSIDVFDFSVIHLSSYERIERRLYSYNLSQYI